MDLRWYVAQKDREIRTLIYLRTIISGDSSVNIEIKYLYLIYWNFLNRYGDFRV